MLAALECVECRLNCGLGDYLIDANGFLNLHGRGRVGLNENLCSTCGCFACHGFYGRGLAAFQAEKRRSIAYIGIGIGNFVTRAGFAQAKCNIDLRVIERVAPVRVHIDNLQRKAQLLGNRSRNVYIESNGLSVAVRATIRGV